MAKHLYSLLPKIRESDCEKEVDSFLQTFPGFPIDLVSFSQTTKNTQFLNLLSHCDVIESHVVSVCMFIFENNLISENDCDQFVCIFI